MLRTLLASKAAKTLATCVCPVAGATAVTMAVPQVRHAVHQATAPRAYAKPKTRVRPAAVAPCPEIAPVLLSAGPAGLPLASIPGQPIDLASGPLPGPGGPLIPIDFGPGYPLGPGGHSSGPGGPGGPGGNPDNPISAVPDAKSWVELIVGFGLVGGATRLAMTRDRGAPPAPEGDRHIGGGTTPA